MKDNRQDLVPPLQTRPEPNLPAEIWGKIGTLEQQAQWWKTRGVV